MASREAVGADGAPKAAPLAGREAAAGTKLAAQAAVAAAAATGEEGTKKRRLFRFRPRYDLVLLSEVITHFPWAAGYGNTRDAWDAVALSVQKRLKEAGTEMKGEAPLDCTIVKRRVDVLLDAFRRGETASLRGAGTPKEMKMRGKLLAILLNVVDLHFMNKGKSEPANGGVSREDRMKQALIEAQQQLRAIDLSSQGEPEEVSPSAPAVRARRMPPYTGIKRQVESETVAAPSKRGRGRPPRSVAATRGRPPSRPAQTPTPVAPVKTEPKRELDIRERELQIKERRLEIEEQRLAWQMKEAEQQSQERLALLDVLRAQSALNQELLALLRAKATVA